MSLRRSPFTDMAIVHNETQNLLNIFALWPLSQIWFCAMGHCGYLVKHYGPLQPILCLLWATAPNFSPCYWPTMPNLVRIRRYGREGGGVIELILIPCCEIIFPRIDLPRSSKNTLLYYALGYLACAFSYRAGFGSVLWAHSAGLILCHGPQLITDPKSAKSPALWVMAQDLFLCSTTFTIPVWKLS